MNHISTNGLVDYALKNGGSIYPLIIPKEKTEGTGLMNPSIFIDGDNILVNVRHINYTLYHSEGKGFPHQWGPLQYVHPEDDWTLRTNNFICHLNPTDFSIKESYMVDMKFNTDPVWHFIGLEDARLFKWDNKLYLCGVRRDHIDSKGTGRMNMSEIIFNGNGYEEVSRKNIPAPKGDKSYCEKNWMPIIDRPYEFVKWTNPVEIAKFDSDNETTESIIIEHEKGYAFPRDIRGSSQVIPWKDHYIAITHEVWLYNDKIGRKDGRYMHRLVVWDKNFKVVNYSEDFSFMKGEIEFVAGMSLYGDDILISFGFQDNAAYLLKMPQEILQRMIVE